MKSGDDDFDLDTELMVYRKAPNDIEQAGRNRSMLMSVNDGDS